MDENHYTRFPHRDSSNRRNRMFPMHSEWSHHRSDFLPIDVAMRDTPESRDFELRLSLPHASPEVSRHSWSSPEIEPKRGAPTAFTRSSEEEDVDDDDSMGATTPPRAEPKRSRYLREADRHAILRRIDRGEKQAELAREFGVTRAAICHINKNRAEILARSNRPDVHAAARHPKRRKPATSNQTQRQPERKASLTDEEHGAPSSVHCVHSHALSLHLANLERPETTTTEFRAIASRAIWILLEEALAFAPTRPVDVVAFDRSVWSGVESTRPTCAIVMNESGYPMLEAFRSIQPESATGSIVLDHAPHRPVTLRKMSAPLPLRGYSIFLLDAEISSSEETCVAIQSLAAVGAPTSSIFVVSLVMNADAAAEIRRQYPRVHLVTAAVDADIGNFQERFFNTTTIHHNELGSNVDL